jgi:hypothetical protein
MRTFGRLHGYAKAAGQSRIDGGKRISTIVIVSSTQQRSKAPQLAAQL